MITIIHVPLDVALLTAQTLIKHIGPDDALTIKYIRAVCQHGYRYRPELDYKFSRPV